MSLSFDSTILYVSDIEKAKNFYVDLLGFVVHHQDGNYLSLKVNSTEYNFVSLYADSKYESIRGKQTIVLKTDQIEKEYQKLRTKGLVFFEELTKKSWGKSFSLKDTDGNKIEIIQM